MRRDYYAFERLFPSIPRAARVRLADDLIAHARYWKSGDGAVGGDAFEVLSAQVLAGVKGSAEKAGAKGGAEKVGVKRDAEGKFGSERKRGARFLRYQ